MLLLLLVFIILSGSQVSSTLVLDSDTNLVVETKPLGEDNFSESTFWNESATVIHPSRSDQFCRNKQNGVYADPESCTTYYRCEDGSLEAFRCTQGYIFEDNTSLCVPEGEVSCTRELEEQDPCFQHDDGPYPDYTSNCQRYFSCHKGKMTHQFDCPRGESYSLLEQACVTGIKGKCIQPNCKDSPDDVFILPGSECRSYYSCHAGVPRMNTCRPGHSFHYETKKCVVGGVCFEPLCGGRINGNFSDTTHDCKRFFTCKDGDLKDVYSCPTGQKHDGRQCVDSAHVVCDKPENTAVVIYVQENFCRGRTDGRHTVEGSDCRSFYICLDGEIIGRIECGVSERFNGSHCDVKNATFCDDLCSLKSDGFYADERKDCQEYYECVSERVGTRWACPEGSLYDGKMCLPASLVFCPKRGSAIDKCFGLAEGFYPDFWNRCRNYFYCKKHEIVLEKSCGYGYAWNGKSCVNEEEFECREPEPWKGCKGLRTGIYPDLNSNCTKYFYCQDGNVTVLSCPRGEIYDGHRCINTKQSRCPTRNKGACANRKDGYAPNPNGGCRSFIYCSQEYESIFLCPGNLVFNGTKCVSHNEYQCPFQINECAHKTNGFYADPASRCTKYIHCVNNEKINTLTCNGKEIFDGVSCVVAEDEQTTCAAATCHSNRDGRSSTGKLEQPCSSITHPVELPYPFPQRPPFTTPNSALHQALLSSLMYDG